MGGSDGGLDSEAPWGLAAGAPLRRPATHRRRARAPRRARRWRFPARRRRECGSSRPVCAPPFAIASPEAQGAALEQRQPVDLLHRTSIWLLRRGSRAGAPQDLVRRRGPERRRRSRPDRGRARLRRRRACAHRSAPGTRRDPPRRRPDRRAGEVRHRAPPAEPALVAQRHPGRRPPNVSAKRCPVARRGRLVDRDPARHAEVQPDVRPAVGLDPEELPAPVRGWSAAGRPAPPPSRPARAGGRRTCHGRRPRRSGGRARGRVAGEPARPREVQALPTRWRS